MVRHDATGHETHGQSRRPAAMPGQYWLLMAGTFVFLVGIEMCYPFQSLFLNEQLGVSMTTVGLILGVTLLVGLPLQFIGGTVADKYGRRPVLILSIVATMTLCIGLGLAHQLWLIVALFALDASCGWAMYLTASNAMIADLTPLEDRAEGFSISRIVLNGGMFIGPLLTTVLIPVDPSFRLAFILGGAICGVFLLMALTVMRETQPPISTADGERLPAGGYREVLRDRRFVAFCAIALLPLYGFGQIWAVFPVMLAEVHGVTSSTWGVLIAVYALSTALLQYPVIRLLQRREYLHSLAGASVCLGAGLGAAAFLPWPAAAATLLPISLGIVVLFPISSALVAKMAPVHLRGRYMGVWTLVYQGGYALGPLLGGWALDALGGRGAFAVVAAAGGLGAVLFGLLAAIRRPPQPAI